MRGNKKKTAGSRKSGTARMWEAVFLFSLIIFMVYLWGRVQINTVLRERTKLEKEKTQLVTHRNNLRIEINRLTSYRRIAPEMAAAGMVPVLPSMRSELQVNFRTKNMPGNAAQPKAPLNYAGIRVPGR